MKNNPTNSFSDVIAVLKYKINPEGVLELTKDETARVISILEKTRDYLTGLEIENEKLKELTKWKK